MRVVNNLTKKYFIIIALILILLPFIFQMDNFFYPLGSKYSDLTITHLPNLIFIRQSLQDHAQIPLWSNQILSGYPFFANPLSGLFYFPLWLIIFLPQPFGFNLLFFAHLFVGSIGFYRYLKQNNTDRNIAIFGALVFALLPKIFSHYALGHVTLVFSFCWLPWLLYFEQKRVQNFKRNKFITGLIIGVIVLADVRWGVYSIVFVSAYSFYVFFGNNYNKYAKVCELLNHICKWSVGIFFQVLIGLMSAAPVLLPLLEYSFLSTRSLLNSSDNLTLSLPPEKLLGLFFPDFGGYAEWMVYTGGATIIVFLLTFSSKRWLKENLFWILASLISVFFALGSYIPINSIIARFPGFNLLRVPGRILFIFSFACVVILVNFLQNLKKKSVAENEKKRIKLISIGVLLFEVLITVAVIILSGEIAIQFIWGCLVCAGFVMALFVYLRYEQQCRVLNILMLLVLVDLLVFNVFGIQFRTKESVYSEGKEIAEIISADDDLFRVYSPSYSLPQHTSTIYELKQAGGIDPLQLISYSTYFEKASGVPQQGYSVTSPPYDTGDPETSNINYIPDASFLGYLNVKYIISAFKIGNDDLILVDQINKVFIYENTKLMPPVWVLHEGSVNYVDLEKMSFSPNEIHVRADGPGTVVFSEIIYSGWNAEVDGSSVPVETVNGVFRAVKIKAGQHDINLKFRPTMMILGGLLQMIAIISVVADWIIRKRI